MYTRYFGLREYPFALSPDPRYLYLSRRHQEALAHLRYGITQAGGFVQLTGEVGTGKTLVIRALLERLPETVDVALILYPFLSVREFVAAILDDLRIPHDKNESSLKALIEALNAYLLEAHARGRRVVLIIDEAQKLSHEILEQVRLLTNLETSKEKLLQILLVGQPELEGLLAQRDLRQLASRVTARYNLSTLSSQETAEYVTHRLRVAGAHAPLFTRAALRAVHRLAHGTPRSINVVCDRALLGAYALSRVQVNAAMVQRAAREVGRPPRRASHALAAAVGALALASALAVAGWYASRPQRALPPLKAAAAPTPAPAVATAVAAATPAPPPAPSLAAVLADPAVRSDTDSAFQTLFARWQLDYDKLPGSTACERAAEAGLRCELLEGSWNQLRALDRPAVVELVDASGVRHNAVVTGLRENEVTLDFAGKTYRFPLATVDARWFGKALVLWRPPVTETLLRRGMQGAGVAWLREALAKAQGATLPAANAPARFDGALEAQVKQFQRLHQLPVDGIVGELTLQRLPSDDPHLDSASATPARAKT